jgi:hypothetical protein
VSEASLLELVKISLLDIYFKGLCVYLLTLLEHIYKRYLIAPSSYSL